jgi:hypothetical protein
MFLVSFYCLGIDAWMIHVEEIEVDVLNPGLIAISEWRQKNHKNSEVKIMII